MKPVRYLAGTIAFLLVWLVVAIVIGVGMAAFFPPPGRDFTAGIGPEWRNLPGTILGLSAGVLAFRAFARGSKKKDDKPVDPSSATAPRNTEKSTEG
jgi:hypothetical protein